MRKLIFFILTLSQFCAACWALGPLFRKHGPVNAVRHGHGHSPKQRMARTLGARSNDAICGRDSPNGNAKCPLDVCCSFAGYCGTTSDFCSLTGLEGSCQQGYGSCEIISQPRFSCGSDSARARSVGYFQLDNKQCHAPCSHSIPNGLTHLFLAFASIDPNSFAVIPSDPIHEALYQDFITLRAAEDLQTWIAVGGWTFSDPGPTQGTWSEMVSCAKNRRKFITSLRGFMEKHGFKGVDIDWEYPGTSERNGNPEDTQNLVSLLKEMRADFGDDYGISVALPTSYWYLQWFDLKAMEEHVDFFGLMTYDLHGAWDESKVVAGHTNITEIKDMIRPLWYAKIDPAKVNFGLAYYGRGYTLSDRNCNELGCPWTGPSNEGPLTKTKGVMSLQEIENLISETGIEPRLLQREMMKQVTWDNQWIGFDDVETTQMKTQWANQYCFGGTLIWSLDQYPVSSNPDLHLETDTACSAGNISPTMGETTTRTQTANPTLHSAQTRAGTRTVTYTIGQTSTSTRVHTMTQTEVYNIGYTPTPGVSELSIRTDIGTTAVISEPTASPSEPTASPSDIPEDIACFGEDKSMMPVHYLQANIKIKSFCRKINGVQLLDEPLSDSFAIPCVRSGITTLGCEAKVKFKVNGLQCQGLRIGTSDSNVMDCRHNLQRIIERCSTNTELTYGGSLTLGNCIEWSVEPEYTFRYGV